MISKTKKTKKKQNLPKKLRKAPSHDRRDESRARIERRDFNPDNNPNFVPENTLYETSLKELRSFARAERRRSEVDRINEVIAQKRTYWQVATICVGYNIILLGLAAVSLFFK